LQINELTKIGIVGPGLLGGSVGLALKSHNITARIIGIGHRTESLDRAVQIGAIDEGSLNLSDLAGCNLVILTTPISLIYTTLDQLGSILSAGTIVTDVGSTKRKICDYARPLAKAGIEFIGSHPIAGSEKRGVDFARHDLFLNANCFITPMKKNNSEAVELVRQLWETVGMRVVKISPREHDKLLAAISHLPHMAAAGLVNACTDAQVKFSGPGFQDTTRIASGDVTLWRDIIMSNPYYAAMFLKKYARELDRLRLAIETGDVKKVCRFLETAKKRRDDLIRFKYEHHLIE
jgi:prephenate dehydrogenase